MDKKDKSTKMIKLNIYFHTHLTRGLKFKAKVAFNAGSVYMPTNHKHGIRGSDVKEIYFGNSQLSLSEAIKKCLNENEITFVSPEKENEYIRLQKIKTKTNFYETDVKL